MLPKPTKEKPVKVYGVVHIYDERLVRLKWTDLLNYPRTFETLFRRGPDGWWSGERFPTGVYSSPLRQAIPVIAEALENFRKSRELART